MISPILLPRSKFSFCDKKLERQLHLLSTPEFVYSAKVGMFTMFNPPHMGKPCSRHVGINHHLLHMENKTSLPCSQHSYTQPKTKSINNSEQLEMQHSTEGEGKQFNRISEVIRGRSRSSISQTVLTPQRASSSPACAAVQFLSNHKSVTFFHETRNRHPLGKNSSTEGLTWTDTTTST